MLCTALMLLTVYALMMEIGVDDWASDDDGFYGAWAQECTALGN